VPEGCHIYIKRINLSAVPPKKIKIKFLKQEADDS
jgi:hypothetical protein